MNGRHTLLGLALLPALALASDRPAKSYFGADTLNGMVGHWLNETLRSMKEPSLEELKVDRSREVYRFLRVAWKGERTVVIRVTIQSDGTGALVAHNNREHPEVTRTITGRE